MVGWPPGIAGGLRVLRTRCRAGHSQRKGGVTELAPAKRHGVEATANLVLAVAARLHDAAADLRSAKPCVISELFVRWSSVVHDLGADGCLVGTVSAVVTVPSGY